MVASASSSSSLLSSIAGSNAAELWLQSCNICSQLMLAAAAAVEQKVRRRGVCRLCYVVCAVLLWCYTKGRAVLHSGQSGRQADGTRPNGCVL